MRQQRIPELGELQATNVSPTWEAWPSLPPQSRNTAPKPDSEKTGNDLDRDSPLYTPQGPTVEEAAMWTEGPATRAASFLFHRLSSE